MVRRRRRPPGRSVGALDATRVCETPWARRGVAGGRPHRRPRHLAFRCAAGWCGGANVRELFADDETQDDDLLPGIASLFNGHCSRHMPWKRSACPISGCSSAATRWRSIAALQRSGLNFGTCLTTGYLHPDGADEFRPILRGRMHTQYPDNEVKRFFTYRNRGYLMSQPGMRKLLPQEYARFGWYFQIQQHDPKGFAEWMRLRRLGRGTVHPARIVSSPALPRAGRDSAALPFAQALGGDPFEDVEFLCRMRRPEVLDLPVTRAGWRTRSAPRSPPEAVFTVRTYATGTHGTGSYDQLTASDAQTPYPRFRIPDSLIIDVRVICATMPSALRAAARHTGW